MMSDPRVENEGEESDATATDEAAPAPRHRADVPQDSVRSDSEDDAAEPGHSYTGQPSTHEGDADPGDRY